MDVWKHRQHLAQCPEKGSRSQAKRRAQASAVQAGWELEALHGEAVRDIDARDAHLDDLHKASIDPCSSLLDLVRVAMLKPEVEDRGKGVVHNGIQGLQVSVAELR